MSDESQNKNEVEELLRSMDAEAKKKATANPTATAAAAVADAIASAALETQAETVLAGGGRPAAPRQRVVAYDFKRPERVGKEQMRALQSLHESFARNFGASLSALLRTIVESKLISVDQLTYSEFVYSLEIPTCFNLLRPMPLDGNWILDISPAILYPIIDRMLGGTASAESQMKRPLSEIELRLTSRITNTFLRELHTAWLNTVSLNVELERVESNPQLVQIVPPNEVVILVSFELTMGKSRGMVNLCIPFNTIERIGSKLTNNSWISYGAAKSSPTSQKQLEGLLGASRVELVVSLARSTIRAVDLFNLSVGDIVTTEKDVQELLEVEVEGVGKFQGKAGAFKGKKAIEIVGPIKQQATPETQPSSSPTLS
jgi:flagellar motor switch protein FliM